LIAFISVLLGAFLSSGEAALMLPAVYVAIAAFLILSAGNAINDCCDVEIDRINKPNRPIPSGRLSRREAVTFAVICSTIGVALSFLVNLGAILISVSVVLLLALYAVKLKRTPLLGNALVALLTGLTFISGGVAVERPLGAIIPALFAFLFSLGRELVKDIEDVKGDKALGARTAPVVWGVGVSAAISAIVMGSVVILTPIPFILGVYTWRYMLAAGIGVDLVMIWCIVWILRSPSSASKVQKVMKFDIIAGLVAIYLS
jgi:geranylgeranylglycerol-phosphate geranylgeranyltransferase